MLWYLEHNNVYFWREEAEEAHVGAQRHRDAQGHYLDLKQAIELILIGIAIVGILLMSYLERVACAEVDGHEGEPDDASGVHREADELGLVEVLWHLDFTA